MGKTLDYLQTLFDQAGVPEIELRGKCHDCGDEISIVLRLAEDGTLTIDTGAVWYADRVFAKCPSCFERDPVLRNYQPCEVYSRICGYMRPVKQWNKGKQAEWDMRKTYNNPTPDTLAD